MTEKNLDTIALMPIEEKPRALFAGCGSFHFRTLGRAAPPKALMRLELA
jgi:hypothetical protein